MIRLESLKILTYWFSELGPEKWFATSNSLDQDIRQKFMAAYEAIRKLAEAKATGLDLEKAEDYLAAILLFDQFPRNMFRGLPQSFATDTLALGLAKSATAQKLDLESPPERRIFFYLPFEHSEELADQDQAIQLVKARANTGDYLKYAELHREIIRRFGRFPHRNKILKRRSTAAEIAFLADGGPDFGTAPETPSE